MALFWYWSGFRRSIMRIRIHITGKSDAKCLFPTWFLGSANLTGSFSLRSSFRSLCADFCCSLPPLGPSLDLEVPGLDDLKHKQGNVISRGLYTVLHRKSYPPLWNHIYPPRRIKFKSSLISLPLQLAQILVSLSLSLSDLWIPKRILFIFPIFWLHFKYSLTFEQYTSYIFPILIFIKCYLVPIFFAIPLPPSSWTQL